MTSVKNELSKHPQLSYILVALVLMLAIVSYFDARAEQDTPSKPLLDFPLVLGNWVGRSQPMNISIVDFLKVSDYTLADYISSDQRVNLYIAYYQSLDEEAFPHSPRQCIPGGGWEIVSVSDKMLPQREVRRVKIERNGYTQLVYYWYQQGSDSLAGEYQLKWNTMLRSLSEGRTDTSLVRLTTLIAKEESESDADARLISFIENLDHELAYRLD